jgi:hypothetical protein
MRDGGEAVHRRIIVLIGVVLVTRCVATGVYADEDETSLIIQATRHAPSGAVVPVSSSVGANGDVQPARAIPGEYILVSGADLPAGAPVQAFLVTPTKTFTLVYRDLSAPDMTAQQALTTDRFGTFANAAFLLPPPEAIHTRNAQVIVLVSEADGGVLPAATSIVFDLPDTGA